MSTTLILPQPYSLVLGHELRVWVEYYTRYELWQMWQHVLGEFNKVMPCKNGYLATLDEIDKCATAYQEFPDDIDNRLSGYYTNFERIRECIYYYYEHMMEYVNRNVMVVLLTQNLNLSSVNVVGMDESSLVLKWL